MTDDEIKRLRELADGFRGRFKFEPENEHCPDRVIFSADDYDDMTISDCIDPHVAEPLVEMLNSIGPLLSHISDLTAAVSAAAERGVAAGRFVGMGELAAMTKARDEACDIADSVASVMPSLLRSEYKRRDGSRIAELRSVGKEEGK